MKQPHSARLGPARKEEWNAALAILFQHLDADDCAARTINALELLERRDLDPDGLLVIRSKQGPLAALLCTPVPGAGSLVWPAQTQAGFKDDALVDQLMTHGLNWLRQRGAKLVQALLGQVEVPLAGSLERNGLRNVTRLIYLRHELEVNASLMGEPDQLTLISYPENPQLFQETLWRTYEETLDCPEVNGVRSLEEVMVGHQSQGKHDPERWWLALHQGEAVGVLLTYEMLEGNSWELSYLGVVPEGRGRGWGRELARRALFEAQVAIASQLTLSVDQRNMPARNLYKSLGFEPFDEKEVYLAVLI